MKKIGIVGGVGWRATAEYYAEICRRAERWHADKVSGALPTPEIVIESLDLGKAFALLGKDGNEESWERFDAYHRGALWRLETAGADVALMASNTPHHRFSEIVRGVGIPVISILDAAAEECRRTGARRVLLLGTALAMRSAKFRAVFAKHGIDLMAPMSDVTRARVVMLVAELQRGRMKGAAAKMGKIVAASWKSPEDPVVCLACTELPLAFPGFTARASFRYGGVTYVNTAAAHIDAVLEHVGIPPEKRCPARETSGPGGKREVSVVSATAGAGGRSGRAADGATAADAAATVEATTTAG